MSSNKDLSDIINDQNEKNNDLTANKDTKHTEMPDKSTESDVFAENKGGIALDMSSVENIIPNDETDKTDSDDKKQQTEEKALKSNIKENFGKTSEIKAKEFKAAK